MMALAVLAVLAAIAWALLDRSSAWPRDSGTATVGTMATVELLGVPAGARVMLDGVAIDNTAFGVSPEVRHAIEVHDADGRSWRQVFLASGALSLVVELRPEEVEAPADGARE